MRARLLILVSHSILGRCEDGDWDSPLTLAVVGAEGDDGLRVARVGAGLVGAVTHAVAEVGVGAVAGDVAVGASELRLGDGEHVGDTGLLDACSQQTPVASGRFISGGEA